MDIIIIIIIIIRMGGGLGREACHLWVERCDEYLSTRADALGRLACPLGGQRSRAPSLPPPLQPIRVYVDARDAQIH